MKKLLLFICLGSLFVISSCGDKHECTVDNVVGIYEGVDDCNSTNVHDETVTITATGNAGEIEYLDDSGRTFITNLDQCNTDEVEITLSGFETKTYNLRFRENEVTLTTQVKTVGINNNSCARTLTKQ